MRVKSFLTINLDFVHSSCARSRSEEFLQLDLPVLLGALPDGGDPRPEPAVEALRPDHDLRASILPFRLQAFLPDPKHPEGWSFHLQALGESHLWEERASDDSPEARGTSSARRDEAALLDMLRAGPLAQEFGGARSREDFFKDLKIQSSVSATPS